MASERCDTLQVRASWMKVPDSGSATASRTVLCGVATGTTPAAGGLSAWLGSRGVTKLSTCFTRHAHTPRPILQRSSRRTVDSRPYSQRMSACAFHTLAGRFCVHFADPTLPTSASSHSSRDFCMSPAYVMISWLEYMCL